MSPDETLNFGRQLGNLLSAGQVVCLKGNLGAGKTLLVQGIAAGLNSTNDVTSPTFTVLNVYQADIPIYHFDLYRLEHPDELYDIGFYEYTQADGVAIIEWPDKFPDQLPDEYLWIEIKPGDQVTERLLNVRAKGSKYQQACEELKNIAYSCFRYSHPSV